MRMSVEHLPAVVGEFFDSVLIPAARQKGGLLTFSTSFVGGLTIRNTQQMAAEYLPLAKSLGIADENGTIDIDLLYQEATRAMKKGAPTIMGYTFDQSDIEKLKELMERHGV